MKGRARKVPSGIIVRLTGTRLSPPQPPARHPDAPARHQSRSQQSRPTEICPSVSSLAKPDAVNCPCVSRLEKRGKPREERGERSGGDEADERGERVGVRQLAATLRVFRPAALSRVDEKTSRCSTISSVSSTPSTLQPLASAWSTHVFPPRLTIRTMNPAQLDDGAESWSTRAQHGCNWGIISERHHERQT